MQHIKVKNVTPLKNTELLVEFSNSIKKKYDVSQLFTQFPHYVALQSEPLFNTVQVDCGGAAIAWTPEIDISECELWENGINI